MSTLNGLLVSLILTVAHMLHISGQTCLEYAWDSYRGFLQENGRLNIGIAFAVAVT